MPSRIQIRRTKGFRLPEHAVYVGRPTMWGNPFRVGGEARRHHEGANSRARAVANFRDWLLLGPDTYWTGEESRARRQAILDHVEDLRWLDLACWCPLDGQPCHADVLLELANVPLSGWPAAGRCAECDEPRSYWRHKPAAICGCEGSHWHHAFAVKAP